MILVAVNYANSFLSRSMSANEFSANKQFMLTTGLQVDDMAWTVGRTQTIRYSSQYGQMSYQSLALNYTFEVNNGTGWSLMLAKDTGMIMFKMPVSVYSMGNNYFERFSSTDNEYLHTGSTAPVTSVYCVEKLPMADGNFTRIVAVPTIRMLTSNITGASGTTNYYKFYLPAMVRGYIVNTTLSQSLTLTGNDIVKQIKTPVNQVRINVTFPNGAPISTQGFGSNFFQFNHQVDAYHCSQTITLQSGSVVELYIGKITISLGGT